MFQTVFHSWNEKGFQYCCTLANKAIRGRMNTSISVPTLGPIMNWYSLFECFLCSTPVNAPIFNPQYTDFRLLARV